MMEGEAFANMLTGGTAISGQTFCFIQGDNNNAATVTVA